MTKELAKDVLLTNKFRWASRTTTLLTGGFAAYEIATHHANSAEFITSFSLGSLAFMGLNAVMRSSELIQSERTWVGALKKENKGSDLSSLVRAGHGHRWLERGTLAIGIPGSIVAMVIPGGLGLASGLVATGLTWAYFRHAEYKDNKLAVKIARGELAKKRR